MSTIISFFRSFGKAFGPSYVGQIDKRDPIWYLACVEYSKDPVHAYWSIKRGEKPNV